MELNESEKKRIVDSCMAEMLDECMRIASPVTNNPAQIRRIFSVFLVAQLGNLLFQFSERSDHQRFMDQWSEGVTLSVCPETLHVTVKDFKSKELIDQFCINHAALAVMQAVESEREKLRSL